MTPELLVQILTLSVIILVPFVAWRDAPSRWAVAGCVIYALSYFVSNVWQIAPHVLDPPYAYGLALRLYQAGSLLLVVVYSATIFMAIAIGVKPDRQAQLVWLVLLIAEGFAFLEYLGCKVATDPIGRTDLPLSQTWAIEGSKYACGRMAEWWTPYLAPIITSLAALWMLVRWRGSGSSPS